MKTIAYHKIFPFESMRAVRNEVLETLNLMAPDPGAEQVKHVFCRVESLFKGTCPGYRACNTGYHDFQHAIDTTLAMSRLMHGATVDGTMFSAKHIYLGIVSAILHDVGYIQDTSDHEGTGAKYAASHEQRGMDFLSRHGAELALSPDDVVFGQTLIFCTNLNADIAAVPFPSGQIELLARMLSAADLMAQLADRLYVDKLPLLYRERTEAALADCRSELDFLYKSVEFYDTFEHHLKTRLSRADRYMRLHFSSKWHINQNLYRHMIDEQKKNLLETLKTATCPASDQPWRS